MRETLHDYFENNWLLVAGVILVVVSLIVGRRLLVVESEIFYSTVLYVGVQMAGWTAIILNWTMRDRSADENEAREGPSLDEFVADDERESESSEISVLERSRRS